MKIVSPIDRSLLAELQADSKETLRKKYERAKEAQLSWSNEPLSRRVECVKKFAQLLLDNTEELAQELSREMGKPISEARGEVKGASAKCRFFIEQSEKHLAMEKVNQDGNTAEVIGYDPLGVVANISAWNYPYLVGINIFVPALICGNSVLYKPSEFSTLVGKSIEKLIHAAGVPTDVFIGVYGEGDIGAELCRLPLNGYFFTGSYATGKKIAVAVADKLVPVGLELGGKDPLYVTEDVANIKNVAESACEGAFYNNGQSCCSVERIYVHEKVYDEFLQHFITATKALKVGNPLEEGTQMGAITREVHLDFLSSLVDDALKNGAKLEVGGSRIKSEGYFFEPTVLTHVNHKMKLMRDETFGPIIGIQMVKDDEEAIKLMNDTDYGLGASIFTSNLERGQAVIKRVHSGTGYVNCCDRVSGFLPWSGRGASGLGTTLSKHGLYAFCNPKGLHIRS